MIPTTAPSEKELEEAKKLRMYKLMCAAYDKMDAEAVDDGEGNTIWTGLTTELFPSVGAHLPEHSYITRLFTMMDVAHQLQRGHRASPSVWVLVQRPTPEMVIRFKDKIQDMRAGRRTSKLEVVRQGQSDLSTRVSVLERWMENIVPRLESLEEDYDERRAI